MIFELQSKTRHQALFTEGTTTMFHVELPYIVLSKDDLQLKTQPEV